MRKFALVPQLGEGFDQHRNVPPWRTLSDEQKVRPVGAEEPRPGGGEKRLVVDRMKSLVGALVDDVEAIIGDAVMLGHCTPRAFAWHDHGIRAAGAMAVESRVGLAIQPAVRIGFGLVDAVVRHDKAAAITERSRIGRTEQHVMIASRGAEAQGFPRQPGSRLSSRTVRIRGPSSDRRSPSGCRTNRLTSSPSTSCSFQ